MSRMSVSVTADIVVFRPDYGQVLVVKRKNPPYQGDWALPGGYVDEGETFLEAAVRELREETGLVVKPENMVFVGIYDDPSRDPRSRTISAGFVTIYDGVSEPVAADDADKIDWASTVRVLAFDHNDIVEDAIVLMWEDITGRLVR